MHPCFCCSWCGFGMANLILEKAKAEASRFSLLSVFCPAELNKKWLNPAVCAFLVPAGNANAGIAKTRD